MSDLNYPEHDNELLQEGIYHGDFQPCPPYVWNHKKYQIQPCSEVQSWWDSNDWLTNM